MTVQRRASGAERSDAKRSEELYQKEVQQGKQSADDSVGGFPTTPVSPLYGSSGLHPEVAKATSVPTRPTQSVRGRESKTERRGNPYIYYGLFLGLRKRPQTQPPGAFLGRMGVFLGQYGRFLRSMGVFSGLTGVFLGRMGAFSGLKGG